MVGTATIGGARPSNEFGGKCQGRYVLGELLGRGGMAEVFSGNSMGDHGFQKPVAIKRLIPELANDHVFVERLISEAKLLVGMQHGNIVSVLDLARDGDDVFLVMDLVDGPSLRQLMKARGTRGISLGVATYIVQHAAQGLEFAHMRPGGAIIHADISPSNLLLTTSGEVRVADFGIARREGLGHGVVEGKWAYMAPEQARGEALTPASDVFALGVVLYELLTGQHPFGRQVTADEREAEAMRVIPPRVVKPSIPAGLDAICMRALSHEPRDRYARMQPFMDALIDERFSNGYRESASDLAAAIRECAVSGPSVGAPRTQVTDRPVTIVTRSLISQPKRLPSQPPVVDHKTATPVPSQSGHVTNPTQASVSVRGSAPVLIPPPLPPMPPFMLSQATTAEELGSVHGGHTASVHIASLPAVRALPRWTFGVLGVAALLGVAAAVAIQIAPSADGDDATRAAPAKVRVEEIKPLDERTSDLSTAVAAPTPPTPPAPTIAPPAPAPAVVAPAPVQAAPPVEPKPVVVEPRPKAHAQRAIAIAHPPTPAPIASPGRKQFVRVSLGAEMWGYLIIDGGAKNEALTNQPITAGKHRFRVIPGNTDDGLEPMSCSFTISPDKVVTTISVNLATRVAIGADSCGH